ncbi:MAG: hypothetical protein WC717_03025 [Candidatus Micrarchaeia archaeon]|jgi:hypothetical protein
MAFKELAWAGGAKTAFSPGERELPFARRAMEDLYLVPPQDFNKAIEGGSVKRFVLHGSGVAYAPTGAQSFAPANTQFGLDFSGTSSYAQAQVQAGNTLALMDGKSVYTVRVMGISTDENGKMVPSDPDKLVPSDKDNYEKGVLEITGTKAQIEEKLNEALGFKMKNERLGSTPIVRLMEETLATQMLSMEIAGLGKLGAKNGEVGSFIARGANGEFAISYVAYSDTGNEYLNQRLGLDGKTTKYFALGGQAFLSTDASASCMEKGKQTPENQEPDWQARMGQVGAVSKALSFSFSITVVSGAQEQTELHSELFSMVQSGAQGQDGKPAGEVCFVNDYAKSAESKIDYWQDQPATDKAYSDAVQDISAVNSKQESAVSKDFTLSINPGGTATVYGDFEGKGVYSVEYEFGSAGKITAPPNLKSVHLITDGSISFADFGSNASEAINTVRNKIVEITQFARDGTNVSDKNVADNDNISAKIAYLAGLAANGDIGKNDIYVLFTDGGNVLFDKTFEDNIQLLRGKGVEIRLVLYRGSGPEELNCGRQISGIINPDSPVTYVDTESPESITSGLKQAVTSVSPENCKYEVATMRYAKATITYNDKSRPPTETYLPINYVSKPDLLKDAGAIQDVKDVKNENAFWNK